MNTNTLPVKALCFDVGGTMLDWRSGLIGELERWGASHQFSVDWSAFANRWRVLGLLNILDKRRDEVPGGNIDGAHRSVLPRVFDEFELALPNPAELDAMTLFWHRLPAWPDVKESLARLRQRYVVSTLTILSVPLTLACSKRNGIEWDALISCEMMDSYKFHPEAYERGCRLLGYKPEEVMMVAAHNLDLAAAKAIGMRTAFVERSEEWGEEGAAAAPDHVDETFEFDCSAVGLADLADQLLDAF